MKITKRLLVSVGALALVAGLNTAAGDGGGDPGPVRANWHCC